MATPIAPQPDPDINDLDDTESPGAASDTADDEAQAQVEDLNLTPGAPGPSGTGDLE